MELETAASTIEVTDSGVVIRWSDGSRSRFHSLWLRDNCPSGGDRATGSRTYSLTELSPDLFVLIAEYDDNGDLLVEFSDGHESTFDFDWLRTKSYEPHDRLGRPRVISTFRAGHSLPAVALPAAGSRDHLDLLDALAEWGVALVDGVATDGMGTEAVADLVGVARASRTVHLHEVIEVHGLGVDPHTTEPYRSCPPGVLVMHCVEAASSGGDVVLVDGFQIAADLQDDDPDSFDALTQLPNTFVSTVATGMADSENAVDLRTARTVISLDRDYDVGGIRFDERSLSELDIDHSQVEAYYRALIEFTKAVNDPGRAVQVSLRPGQVLLVDNHRILHGRTNFSAVGGQRHIRWATIDRDDFHGELRTLRARFGSGAQDRFATGCT